MLNRFCFFIAPAKFEILIKFFQESLNLTRWHNFFFLYVSDFVFIDKFFKTMEYKSPVLYQAHSN